MDYLLDAGTLPFGLSAFSDELPKPLAYGLVGKQFASPLIASLPDLNPVPLLDVQQDLPLFKSASITAAQAGRGGVPKPILGTPPRALNTADTITGLASTGVASLADDFAANTSTTGSLSIGGSRTGLVSSNADRDWFRVSLTAGETYRFNLNGDTLTDPTLALRNSFGTQLAFNDDFSGSNSQITYTATTTGTYYLDAGAYSSGTGSYTLLAANTTPLPTTDDFAGNTSTTGSISIGGSSSGVVNFNADRDWFRVSLVAGRMYRFSVAGDSPSNPDLHLRNASGNSLGYSSDSGGSLNPILVFTAQSSGDYYLDVGSNNNVGAGSYALSARDVPVNEDYAATINTTGLIPIGASQASVINFGGDRDWFRVSLTAGQTYRFNLNGNTLTDPTLSLLDVSGRNVLASNDNFGTGRNSQITFTATTTGTHFLDAKAIGSLTGSYELSATDLTIRNDRITGLLDWGIRRDVNKALADNVLTHQEISTLLRNTGTNGILFQELSDLKTIANQFSPYLSATSRSYTQYIYNAVVNGNPANQWWTGGASERTTLGNLTVGSSQLQMNRLVDKWFGGLDLPTNLVGGDAAAGKSDLTFTYGPMTGPLFASGISFSDINQGQAGTCYFLAAASTLANNRSQLISNMFRDNGDGTYGVRFYSSTGNELWVTVNRSVPVLPDNRLALAGNSSRSLAGEMWVALAEKAYAQANEIGAFARSITANSYQFIEYGNEEALRHITNLSPKTYSSFYTSDSSWTTANDLAEWNSYQSAVISAVNAGSSLILLSGGDTIDSNGKQNIVSKHAFAITGYNAATNRFTVVNPWGAAGSETYAGVFEASWQDFFNVKGSVSWV